MPIVPPKLRPGSSVRVIAPSRSLAIIGSDVRAEARRKLAALGYTKAGVRRSEDPDLESGSEWWGAPSGEAAGTIVGGNLGSLLQQPAWRHRRGARQTSRSGALTITSH